MSYIQVIQLVIFQSSRLQPIVLFGQGLFDPDSVTFALNLSSSLLSPEHLISTVR